MVLPSLPPLGHDTPWARGIGVAGILRLGAAGICSLSAAVLAVVAGGVCGGGRVAARWQGYKREGEFEILSHTHFSLSLLNYYHI